MIIGLHIAPVKDWVYFITDSDGHKQSLYIAIVKYAERGYVIWQFILGPFLVSIGCKQKGTNDTDMAK
jgi:hypothetical protein